MLLYVGVLSAQDTGSVTGTLLDKDAGNQPLPFANVLIKGTSKGTTTDFDGKYSIEGLDPGTYILEFSFVGYETKENEFIINAGENKVIDGALGASAAVLDDVIIKATSVKKESVQALLLDQQNAVVQKQSIGAQELSSKAVSNAAAAVTKISGISKQEGGGNVYVRGLGDRYLNTTFNGLSLPANNVDKKK